MAITNIGRPMLGTLKQFGPRNTCTRRLFRTSHPVLRSFNGQGAPPIGVKDGLVQGLDPMTGESIAPVGSADIDASKLRIEKTNAPKSKLNPTELRFGQTFTDHMLILNWSQTAGWSAPSIQPYQPLVLDPSATIFHYAPSLFEGMKAYKGSDGSIRLFRPDKNMQRMNNSAERLAFPRFDGSELVKLIKSLVELDADWIPTEPGYSLYIRPTMIGTQVGLGVSPSTDVMLFVICSPVGPYYKTGFKPVSLLASTEYVRAWPGGTGAFKLGANYAPGVVPQVKAARDGFQQILWLFGEQHELTEVGTMNLFLAIERDNGQLEVVTPPLDDKILPGITRDSALALLRGHADNSNQLDGLPKDLVISERKICMAEVVEASRKSKLREVFGTGTAAIVSSVNCIGYEGQDILIPVESGGLGDIAAVVQREILGRQTGMIPSDWSVIV
ncbi:hypothetical protein CROQUDRAFT_660997 [Cronartium quercuum f. sp. fusiforme G11]|uniref:Branched-chain-amino-acid aminotransferase n=1 Tax=Cronartium quercuum f. sp. fusiforme G11 TaxID=708437 RepID=A0A9P6T8Z5_9BASI|nr:hypothetical protein CROQUDRAFT_660997 [Cronartium quercuum f. sp. fusiforme G11]